MKGRLIPFKPVDILCKSRLLLGIVLLFNAGLVRGQLITNVSASTGHPYAVSTLSVNVPIYTDRTYKATSVPSYLNNAPFIKTPNADKSSKSSVSFKLSQAATVYIGYDPRATALPTWLSTWQKLSDKINITDPDITHFDLYSKSFSAGTVTLGGNVASPAAGVKNMSIIIAVASSGAKTAPTVNLTSPSNNATVNGSAITINASATDADGAVAKVEFYSGSALLSTDISSPFSFTWKNVAPGTYSLTAKAIDNDNLFTTSAPVSIKVTASSQTPPSVAITVPSTDTTYTTVPATINMKATATAYNSSIKKVEFYKGSALVKTELNAPYTCTLNNVSAGSYVMTAKAIDTKGLTTTSSSVTISVVKHSNPSVVSVDPPDKSTNVNIDESISTNLLYLPDGGIDNNTITSSSVYLTESATGKIVSSNVNGTGGGDAITLVPASFLKKNTVYKLHITSGVKDANGTSFAPYTSTFTTNSASIGTTGIQFEKVALTNAVGRHTCVTIGPDGKLYALKDDGLIKRFVINSNGTLGDPEMIYSLQDSYGPRQKTLSIGLTFDPSSTASNLIAYVTHCNTYAFFQAPDWDDKLTKLSGNNLQTVQDILINLPRSAKDHVTNSIAFGPDGALYFTQGAICAMGQGDATWNYRKEHLLTCAVLRLDRSKLGTLPLDVKTTDAGGSYNPYAANAPLTIYASGVRNSYDLVWHSNGNLYAATNGSAAGGNTPASVNGTMRTDGSTYSGPKVPGLTNVQQTQSDFLYQIVKGGYYGQPNPTRGEYVLNGGNPTSSQDVAEVPAYPIGTLPDKNWRGNIFDFQNNVSPDGFIEYKSNTFNGALKGKLLFVRYSAYDDIITLTPGTNDDIISSVEGSSTPGFTGFIDPLDITEDVKTGNLYVSEYGGDKGTITLLRPSTASARSLAKINNPVKPIANGTVITNTIAGCDAGIQVVIAVDKNVALWNLNKPTISPNPVQKNFNLHFPNSYKGEYTLQIADISGRVYQIGKINSNGGINMGIDISQLSLKAGTYFLKMTSESNKPEVFKLIVIGN